MDSMVETVVEIVIVVDVTVVLRRSRLIDGHLVGHWHFPISPARGISRRLPPCGKRPRITK